PNPDLSPPPRGPNNPTRTPKRRAERNTKAEQRRPTQKPKKQPITAAPNKTKVVWRAVPLVAPSEEEATS
ncbi:hypothetical protein A2U01_0085564, partial [Trifolium medium]|nr:hypothetical protein [Trifolium medium]